MRQPKDFREYGREGCCPGEWDHTPVMTGHYEMDGAIQRCHNPDMRGRLSDHLAGSAGDNAYPVNSGYRRGGTDY